MGTLCYFLSSPNVPETPKKQGHKRSLNNFFTMSTSTPTQQTNTYSEERALAAIDALSSYRELKNPLSSVEVKLLTRLLKTYMGSPSRRTKPTRTQLSKAVKALLEQGSRPLSQTWNKTQFAVALLHWVEVVVSLSESLRECESEG